MPNRIIKESVCTSETVNAMTWFEECFYHRLWTHCDDFGRMDARPRILKAKLFPLKDRLSLKEVEDALLRLVGMGCVVLYDCDGLPFLYLPSWSKHQRVRDSKEKYPPPAAATCGDSPPESNPNPNPNPNPDPIRARKFVPPTLEEVRAYCLERGNTVGAERFFDYFAAANWVDSAGKPVKNWKQKIIAWEGRAQPPGQGKDTANPFLAMLREAPDG